MDTRKNQWICKYCNKINEPDKHEKNRKFCNSTCSGLGRRKEKQQKWLETGKGYDPRSIKSFLMDEQQNKCSICNMENLWNGNNLIFVLDHIDGNSQNNWRSNLRCICPNCDSQLDTYKGKNAGKGRHSRKIRYQEGKSY